jgi:hypothetical protein
MQHRFDYRSLRGVADFPRQIASSAVFTAPHFYQSFRR